MSHNMASRVFEVRLMEEKYQDYTATLDDGLQVDSLAEFLRTAILGLAIVLGASAVVYLSFLAISLLFVSFAG